MLARLSENHLPSAVTAVLLSCLASTCLLVLHPRIAVRDMDGYAYIMGARSLHEWNGYRDLIGEAFNHWPPGYSLLLSVFPDSIPAAMIINYLSFGMAVGLLYYLLRRSGWTWQAAGGFSLALASGFFRLLANQARADILTYALFLAAACAATQGRQSRLLPSLIWALLIPVKLIAVVFLPTALCADYIASCQDWKRTLRSYIPGVFVNAVSIVGILFFNYLTIRSWMPPRHGHSSLEVLFSAARPFVISIARELLFNWHGPVGAPFPRIAFLVCMLLSAMCLFSLRPAPERKWCTVYGLFFLVCSGLLFGVRSYDPSVRLTGYGLIILFLGFRPKRWANPIWLLYGFTSLAICAVNAMTVNSLGSNDPRYADLAAQVRAYYEDSKSVATNSFHLLDLHANIPSVRVTDYDDAAQYETFLWVTLPSFDPCSESPVNTIAHPGQDWCEQKQLVGGILFSRCKHSGALAQ
jgi:hypothetical protein